MIYLFTILKIYSFILSIVSFNDIDTKPEVKTFSISIEVNTNMSAKEITDVVLEKLSKNIK